MCTQSPHCGCAWRRLDLLWELLSLSSWVSLCVRTCELFLCFVAIVRVSVVVLTSLLSLSYVAGEFHRFLHRGRAVFMAAILVFQNKQTNKQADTPTVVEGGGGETPPSVFFVLYKQNKINLHWLDSVFGKVSLLTSLNNHQIITVPLRFHICRIYIFTASRFIFISGITQSIKVFNLKRTKKSV